MSAVPFDTLKYLETLKEAGVPEEQAKAMTTGLAEAMTTGLAEAVDMNLATKEDLKLLKNELIATMWKMQVATIVIVLSGMFAILRL